MKLSAVFPVLGVVASSIALLPQNKGTRFDWKSIQYVYAFGDSYSFVQGTAGHANFSFIGDAFRFAFTPHQIFSNEIIPRNTSSEGANWLEFLTGCFFGRPSECSIQLWDFAFAGADVDSSLLPLHHNFTVSLVDEVKQWAQFGSNILPRPAGQTLTTWWIGINDTGDTVTNTTITNFTAFWETEMTSYFDAVQLAYDTGLKGTHLFINVPPEERSPGSLSDPKKAALLKDHIKRFNAALDRRIDDFRRSHPESVILRFDAHAWFNSVLDSPSSFGFNNTTGFCTCLEPGFFWYNSGHPTERVHKLLAEAVERFLLAQSGK